MALLYGRAGPLTATKRGVWPGRAGAPNSRPMGGAMPPDSNTTHAPSYTANLLWALHDCWRQWAYTGGDASRGP